MFVDTEVVKRFVDIGPFYGNAHCLALVHEVGEFGYIGAVPA